MTTVTSQISALTSKYSSSIARQIRSARSHVRKYFPQGYELVFENANALGFGYSFSDRGSGVLVSIVAYPRWLTLFFFEGTELPDPVRLLEGSGARIRSVRLDPFALLQSSEVAALLDEATRRHRDDFAGTPPLATVLKSVAKTRRPRRPAAGGTKVVGSRRSGAGKVPPNKSLERSRKR